MNIKKIKLNDKHKEKNEHLKKINKKLGKTFLSKFLIKVTSKIFIPSIHLQILRYETCNRSNEEIMKVMPFFKTKGNFDNYINLKEYNGKINNLQIIYDLASQAFYKYKKAFSIIKKPDENGIFFFLLLNGEIERLNLKFVKKKISIENYLVYIIKLELLKENYILEKCNKLNKNIINININHYDYFEENGIIYNLKEIRKKVKEELINEGFDFLDNNKILIPSIDKYINMSKMNMSQRRDTYTGYELYIGYYFNNGILKKGDYIGDLSKNETYEKCTYICKTDCDIISLDKKFTQLLKFKLYDYILSKLKNIFVEIKPKYYIFNDLSYSFCLNNILPLLIYKTFKKGEKIICQFSEYEGIYLIINGQIKLTLSQTHEELTKTLSDLSFVDLHFKDYVSKALNNIDLVNEFHLSHIIKNKNKNDITENNKEENLFLSSNRYNESFKGINNIEFFILEGGDSLGFNELFDYKTGLYNFNAECISEEANLFFISKKDFNNLSDIKNEILKNIIQISELKAKNLIRKINIYKNKFEESVIKSIKFKKISSKSCSNFFKKDKDKKENNLKLFKNNNLLQYFRRSNFFDYSHLFNYKNKFKIKNSSETDKSSNINKINYYRFFKGFNNLKINKKIFTKMQRNKLNLNMSDIILNDFKKKYFNNSNNSFNISIIKSENEENKYQNKKYKNIKQITRISSLPFLNNFYRININ